MVKLDNARITQRQRNKQHTLPTIEQLSKIEVGTLIRVNCNGEYLTLKVISFIIENSKTEMVCSVQSDVVMTEKHGVKKGDNVNVEYHNIYQIF